VEGGYDAIAKSVFKGIRAERLLLEYDDARSGSFDALREVPDDKTVVLGLITTKSSRLETIEALKRRVDEAAQFMPLERLAISPQCGFSTSIVGNRISIEDEKKKLRVLAEAAKTIWG
jgi:5-methyltetrahydropteroyltriglutamate--homocysteine methyltransferase